MFRLHRSCVHKPECLACIGADVLQTCGSSPNRNCGLYRLYVNRGQTLDINQNAENASRFLGLVFVAVAEFVDFEVRQASPPHVWRWGRAAVRERGELWTAARRLGFARAAMRGGDRGEWRRRRRKAQLSGKSGLPPSLGRLSTITGHRGVLAFPSPRDLVEMGDRRGLPAPGSPEDPRGIGGLRGHEADSLPPPYCLPSPREATPELVGGTGHRDMG